MPTDRKCSRFKGELKQLCEKGDLLIEAYLSKEVTEDNWAEGAGTHARGIISETLYAKDFDDLAEQLENYGLELDDFAIFSDEEPNRLTFNRDEDEDGIEKRLTEDDPDGYLADYDLTSNPIEQSRST